MARSLVLVFLAYIALTEARNLKGEKGDKQSKAPKGGYKASKKSRYPVTVGSRPYFIVDSMADSELKAKLSDCAESKSIDEKSDWSIGHRGACMQYPEHTLDSYKAALIQGAGIVECDVTFTKDKQLICRHAQCDLHTTTDVVARPELNAKCTTPYVPGGDPVCCASDFTLEDIKTLCAKMDSKDSSATDATGYLGGVADYRTTMYSYECPKVPTHIESIELIKDWGAKFTPELKTPQVDMPYEGTYTQEDYAQQMIDEYIEAGVDQSDVWPQSFLWDDVVYWNSKTDFKQSVALVGSYEDYDISAEDFVSKVADIKTAGVSYMAPPMWMLLALDEMGEMTMSNYASLIKEHGFDIITWTLERSGPLTTGGGWYYQSITEAIDRDGNQFELLQALHEKVGIVGIFSDWPATTTFYANCMGL